MSVPYHLSCLQQHPLLYPLSDGRFQIMERGDLAPLMVGSEYVIVANSFAEYLKDLSIQQLHLVDATIFDPREKTEVHEFKQLVVKCHFIPGSMSDIDLTQEIFLLMDGSYLFVSPSLKNRLEQSPFKYLRFSYGLREFSGHQYIGRLKTVNDLRRWDVDRSFIEKAEADSRHRNYAQVVAGRIREAFFGVTLDDGIGLWQAQAIDDYEDKESIIEARMSDEKEAWIRITSDNLNACESSLAFFDAKGMRFHLPAYLIADLEGKYLHNVAFWLTDIGEHGLKKFDLLSPIQRAAIRDYLKHIAADDNYEFDRPNILRALKEYWV